MLFEIFKNENFRIPLLNLFFLILGLVLENDYLFWIPLLWGIYKFLEESYEKIKEKNYSLDYLAFLSLLFSLIFKRYLVGGIIGVMYLTSTALEEFGITKAENAIKDLINNFPKECILKDGRIKKIQEVKKGEVILIRSKEVVPLDGYLLNEGAILNEINLTGEAFPVEFKKGDFIKSGVINLGQTIEIEVSNEFESSNYQKIFNLVKEAKNQAPNFVRFTEKLNFPFTILTLILAASAWFLLKNPDRVLAILAIATPCPLLIAAPISFIGSISKGIKNNIIIKKPVLMETFGKIKVILFDKTGTLTLGNIFIKEFKLFKEVDKNEVLRIIGSLEMHSIHPIAKSITNFTKQFVSEFYYVDDFKEKIGEGICGKIKGNFYEIKKSSEKVDGIGIDIFENGEILARFVLDDVLKDDAIDILKIFNKDYILAIVTGDREENVKRFLRNISVDNLNIKVFSDCSPEMKFELVKEFKKKYGYVAVVGDGINDAPALALADIGIVFSGTENSAALEVADVVILSHEVRKVFDVFEISKRSYKIAKQSVFIGMGLSLIGMLFAFFGFITPELAAFIQEIIDFLVIFNALRSTF